MSGVAARSANGNTPDQVRVAIVAPDVFGGNGLEHTFRFHGITTVARSDDPGVGASLATATIDTFIRFIAVETEEFDPAELQAVRAVHPTVGLVLLTLARDIRLLGLATTPSFPTGTRVLSVHDAGGTTHLASCIRSAAKHPFAPQRMAARLALTDDQIMSLRAVAAGLDNKEFAAERSTTVSAARQLVNRTARQLGIPPTTSPSQQRALMSTHYSRLLAGAAMPRPQPAVTLAAGPRSERPEPRLSPPPRETAPGGLSNGARVHRP